MERREGGEVFPSEHQGLAEFFHLCVQMRSLPFPKDKTDDSEMKRVRRGTETWEERASREPARTHTGGETPLSPPPPARLPVLALVLPLLAPTFPTMAANSGLTNS
ncbi:UNVERIFIED_CONTAM: hypothetical protein K2H54_066246 [Gekko kuhli]